MTGRATMTGNATMTGRATGCLKKSGPRKRFLAIFSCWMVLYGPKQCCMIRAYRCAALDTPLAYIRKKIDLRPPGPQAPGAVFWPPGRILARKSVFCYRTPDFVNGPFLALDDHTVPEQELNISKKMIILEAWTFYLLKTSGKLLLFLAYLKLVLS